MIDETSIDPIALKASKLRIVAEQHACKRGREDIAEDFGSYCVERVYAGKPTWLPLQFMFMGFFQKWLGHDAKEKGQVKWKAFQAAEEEPPEVMDIKDSLSMTEAKILLGQLDITPVERACFLLNVFYDWEFKAISSLFGMGWSTAQQASGRVKAQIKRLK